MRNLFLLFLLTLASLWSIAQVPETNPSALGGVNWIFGKNIWLDFTNQTLIQKPITNVDILEGTSSYSDSMNFYYLTGNGGFQSKLHLNDSIITTAFNDDGGQGVLFLVHPSNENLWFFGSGSGGNGGYSKVKSNTKTIEYIRFPTNVGEKQQAVNHQNGRDIWYANHAREGDSVFFFLLKKDGMIECPVVTHTGLNYYGGENGWSTQGQMKFSPDGKYLAEAVSSSPFGCGIYRFNAEYPTTDSIYIWEKGFVTDYRKNWPYGLEFSPNASKLYISAGRANDLQEPDNPPTLYQLNFDSLKNDINGSSWISIDSMWGIEDGALQLAPDGKIYQAMPNQTYLSVINDPNELGLACNRVRQGLTLDSGGISRYGLPTFNQSYFHTPAIDFHYEEDCFTNTYSFKGLDTFGGSSFKWTFRDTRNETVEVRLDKNVFYSFPQADSLENKYEVTFIASNGSVSDSVTKTLTIRPKLTNDFLGRDTFYCRRFPPTGGQADSLAQGDNNFELNLATPPDLHCIHWGVNGEVLEPYSNLRGDTTIGYENFYGHISANTYRTIDTAGVYTARITNKAFCRAWDTIRVTEKPNPQQPNIQRISQELESTIAAAEYRWYYEGRPKFQNEISKIQPDSNGYWQVQLVSEFGCESELSDSLLVGFASVPSIKATNALSFKVYPNPSDGNISIKVPKQGEYNIQITDLNGKVVYTTKHNLNLSFEFEFVFAKGTYIVTLTDEEGNTGSKQIVVR